MSTKIYNGYRLPNFTLRELNNWMKDARKVIQPLAQELYTELVVNIATNILDIKTLYPNSYKERIEKNYSEITKHSSALSVAERYIREQMRQIQITQERNPKYDFECTVYAIPIQDSILLLFYSEQAEFESVFSKLPMVEYYGYWNNTDPDEECTEEQWEKRKRDWEEALGGDGLGVPSECGMSFQLVNEHKLRLRRIITKNKNIKMYQESFNERVNCWAYKITLDKVISRISDDKIVGTSNGRNLEPFWQARDYLKTPEGKIEVQREADRIASLLKDHYTMGDLLENFLK